MKLSNEAYDALKWWALIVLPAIGAAYFALAEIWGLPYATQVVGTLVIAETFIGTVMQASSAKYNRDDSEEIEHTPGKYADTERDFDA